MIKKAYMKPDMKVVPMRHRESILMASESAESYGVKKNLQNAEVDNAW